MIKNPQFLSNWHEIKAILPTHGLIILTKFHYNWAKIVDFLSLANFCARVIFFVRVSSLDLFSKMMMCMGTFIGYSKVFSILLVML